MNVGFIHPDSQPLTPKILDQLDDFLLVLSRVTDENIRVHVNSELEQFGYLLSMDKTPIVSHFRPILDCQKGMMSVGFFVIGYARAKSQ